MENRKNAAMYTGMEEKEAEKKEAAKEAEKETEKAKQQEEKAMNQNTKQNPDTGKMTRRELEERRTGSTKTFENSDHSFTTEIYLSPVHYQAEGGSWEEMDDTLEAVEIPVEPEDVPEKAENVTGKKEDAPEKAEGVTGKKRMRRKRVQAVRRSRQLHFVSRRMRREIRKPRPKTGKKVPHRKPGHSLTTRAAGRPPLQHTQTVSQPSQSVTALTPFPGSWSRQRHRKHAAWTPGRWSTRKSCRESMHSIIRPGRR